MGRWVVPDLEPCKGDRRQDADMAWRSRDACNKGRSVVWAWQWTAERADWPGASGRVSGGREEGRKEGVKEAIRRLSAVKNAAHVERNACNLSLYTYRPEGGDSPVPPPPTLPPDGISNSCIPPLISTGGRVLSLRVALSEAKHRRVAGRQNNPLGKPLGNTCSVRW